MARSKFNFEKRQKEKARQQKQQEKTARRRDAKQQKTATNPDTQSEDAGVTVIEDEFQPLAEGEPQS